MIVASPFDTDVIFPLFGSTLIIEGAEEDQITTGDHRVNAVISYKNSEIAKVWFTALY